MFPVEKTGGYAVGCNHKVFDDLLGPIAFIHPQVLDLVSGKDWAGFQRLQVQSTVLMPQGFQLLRHPVLNAEILCKPRDNRYSLRRRPFPFQPGRHAVIGQLGVVAHPGTIDIRALHFPPVANDHLDDHGRAVFILI